MTAPNTSQTAPASKATAPSIVAGAVKAGKKKLTEAELAQRKATRKAESPQARFSRIVRPRIGRALEAMARLETVGKNYEYTPEQAGKVLQHLTDAVARVKVAFVPSVRGSKAVQELPDI